jgi:hypothetical protein
MSTASLVAHDFEHGAPEAELAGAAFLARYGGRLQWSRLRRRYVRVTFEWVSPPGRGLEG